MSEPFFADDGSYLGELAYSEDGEAILFDEGSGTVLDAIGADGEQLDPDDFTITGYDDIPMADEPGHLDAIEARLTAAEQAVQQPLHVIHEMRRPDPLATQADIDEVMRTLDEQVSDLELALGRKLVLDERRVIAEHVADAAGRGETVSADDALTLAGWRDQVPSFDTETDHGRQAYMAQRLMDNEHVQQAERGERDLARADHEQPYDYGSVNVENDQERQQAMVARLEGRPDSNDAREL